MKCIENRRAGDTKISTILPRLGMFLHEPWSLRLSKCLVDNRNHLLGVAIQAGEPVDAILGVIFSTNAICLHLMVAAQQSGWVTLFKLLQTLRVVRLVVHTRVE